MGRGWERSGDKGDKGMQIFVTVRHDLCSPMPFHSAKNAILFLPKLAMALLALVVPPLSRARAELPFPYATCRAQEVRLVQASDRGSRLSLYILM